MGEKENKRNEFINSLKVKNNQEKYNKYYIYKNVYKELYKKYTILEYKFLKEKFPDVDFDIHIRLKSYLSAKNKIDKSIMLGKNGNIYDRLAKKYIIKSNNNIKDEQVLEKTCYDFKNVLIDEFPIFLNQNYQTSVQKNIDCKYKDYIKNAKNNGYKSIHLTQMHIDKNNKFYSETQIKTYKMHEVEKYGNASHAKNYKDRDSILKEKNLELAIPQYMEIKFDTERNEYFIKELGFENNFEYFFGYPYSKFLENINSNKNKNIIKGEEYEKFN